MTTQHQEHQPGNEEKGGEEEKFSMEERLLMAKMALEAMCMEHYCNYDNLRDFCREKAEQFSENVGTMPYTVLQVLRHAEDKDMVDITLREFMQEHADPAQGAATIARMLVFIQLADLVKAVLKQEQGQEADETNGHNEVAMQVAGMVMHSQPGTHHHKLVQQITEEQAESIRKTVFHLEALRAQQQSNDQ